MVTAVNSVMENDSPTDAALDANEGAGSFSDTIASQTQSVTPSITYGGTHSLTVEVFNENTQSWDQIDTKSAGRGVQGAGNLASFDVTGDLSELKVRILNNKEGTVYESSSDNARVTKQADGGVVINFEDLKLNDSDLDFNDAVVTLRPGGATSPTPAPAPSEGGFNFDSTQLVDLLKSLEKMTEVVDSSDIAEPEQNDLLDHIISVTELITEILSATGDQGGDVTLDEMTAMLDAVSSLQQLFEDGMPGDGDEERSVLDEVIDAVDTIKSTIEAEND